MSCEPQEVDSLPGKLHVAMRRHEEMYKALLAYRTAFLYELPSDGQHKAGGAVCAVMAEVARRFGPHLREWRRGGGGGGNVSGL